MQQHTTLCGVVVGEFDTHIMSMASKLLPHGFKRLLLTLLV
jgi:hypothetical protein